MKKNKIILSTLLVGMLNISASFGDEEVDIVISDPYESFNRSAFIFNDQLDKAILKPAAEFYSGILPSPVRQGIGNFFTNFSMPSVVVNDFLQSNFNYMANDFWRFVINSTIGIGGIFDIANEMGLKPHTTDFGITLAKWGWKRSNFLVVPLWGSSSPRDGIGVLVDYYGLSFYPYIEPVWQRWLLLGWVGVQRRAEALDYKDLLDAAEFDPYSFRRSAYIQRRNFLLEDSIAHSGFKPIDTELHSYPFI